MFGARDVHGRKVFGWGEGGWWEGGELVNRPIRSFTPEIGIGEKANHTKAMPFAFFPPSNEGKIKNQPNQE